MFLSLLFQFCTFLWVRTSYFIVACWYVSYGVFSCIDVLYHVKNPKNKQKPNISKCKSERNKKRRFFLTYSWAWNSTIYLISSIFNKHQYSSIFFVNKFFSLGAYACLESEKLSFFLSLSFTFFFNKHKYLSIITGWFLWWHLLALLWTSCWTPAWGPPYAWPGHSSASSSSWGSYVILRYPLPKLSYAWPGHSW